MTSGRIFAVVCIYILASVAWFILGGTVVSRTQAGYQNIGPEVQNRWGSPLVQVAPSAAFLGGAEMPGTREAVDLNSSKIVTGLSMDYRRRGLLWFPCYAVDFDGAYEVANTADAPRTLAVTVKLPAEDARYDAFQLAIDDHAGWTRIPGGARITALVGAGKKAQVHLQYKTRGLRSWSYAFGDGVQRVRHFSLQAKTDFDNIDFPEGTISPTTKTPDGNGWNLRWESESMLSGFKIGINVPEKLNPGDVASRIAFFAPVGLLFFFTVMLISCLMQQVNLHPMHFAFIAAGFFAFQLLFTYLVDHVSITAAFVVAAAVSLGMVVNYMRLVTNPRFALLPTGVAQMVYLILFSYAFFFKGYTGLTIAIGAVLTLGVLMQITAKVDWEQTFRRKETPRPSGTIEGCK